MGLYRNVAGFKIDGLSLYDLADPGEGSSVVAPADATAYSLPDLTGLVTLNIKTGKIEVLDPGTGTVTYDPGFPVQETPTVLLPKIPDPTGVVNTDLLHWPHVTPPTIPLADDTPTPSAQTDYLPLITLGGLVLTALWGERYLKKRRKIVFVMGLGALYYQFSKKEL